MGLLHFPREGEKECEKVGASLRTLQQQCAILQPQKESDLVWRRGGGEEFKEGKGGPLSFCCVKSGERRGGELLLRRRRKGVHQRFT